MTGRECRGLHGRAGPQRREQIPVDFVEGAGSGGRQENLEETSWDRWFEIFDDRDLVFPYSPERERRFFKLISEETAQAT